MQKDIDIISMILASFIYSELSFLHESSEKVEEVSESETTKEIVEEVIDYFKSSGPVVVLRGNVATTKLYNILLFNKEEAYKYYRAVDPELIKSCPVLTIKDFLTSEKTKTF